MLFEKIYTLAFGKSGEKSKDKISKTEEKSKVSNKSKVSINVWALLLVCIILGVYLGTIHGEPANEQELAPAGEQELVQAGEQELAPANEQGMAPAIEQSTTDVTSAEQFLAEADIGGDVGKVLFVSEGAYLNPESGVWESFRATIYCRIENVWYECGEVSGSGTAYPLRYNQDGILVAGGHYVGVYVPNMETKQLELVEYAREVFDEKGEVTYWYCDKEKGEYVVEDSSYLEQLISRYSEAETVDFGKENFDYENWPLKKQ